MIDSHLPPYRLVRSKRRTLALTLDPDGGLIARAPRRMPLRDVEGFIVKKAKWIEEKQALLRQRASIIESCPLTEGSGLPYLGGTLRIAYTADPRPHAADGVLFLPRRGDPLTHARRWLEANAEETLLPLVEQWSLTMGVRPASVSFGYAKGRWGSMSSIGSMRLNIALLHCPRPAIHYVIVHELAHRLHPNHSKAFHACVDSFLPSAPLLRAQMKDMTPYLSLLRPADAKEAP